MQISRPIQKVIPLEITQFDNEYSNPLNLDSSSPISDNSNPTSENSNPISENSNLFSDNSNVINDNLNHSILKDDIQEETSTKTNDIRLKGAYINSDPLNENSNVAPNDSIRPKRKAAIIGEIKRRFVK